MERVSYEQESSILTSCRRDAIMSKKPVKQVSKSEVIVKISPTGSRSVKLEDVVKRQIDSGKFAQYKKLAASL